MCVASFLGPFTRPEGSAQEPGARSASVAENTCIPPRRCRHEEPVLGTRAPRSGPGRTELLPQDPRSPGRRRPASLSGCGPSWCSGGGPCAVSPHLSRNRTGIAESRAVPGQVLGNRGPHTAAHTAAHTPRPTRRRATASTPGFRDGSLVPRCARSEPSLLNLPVLSPAPDFVRVSRRRVRASITTSRSSSSISLTTSRRNSARPTIRAGRST